MQLYFSALIEQGNMVFGSASTALVQENLPEAAKKYTELGTITVRMQKEFALAGNKLEAVIRRPRFTGDRCWTTACALRPGHHRLPRQPVCQGTQPQTVTGQMVAEITNVARSIGTTSSFRTTASSVICSAWPCVPTGQIGKVPDAMQVLKLLRRTHGYKARSISPAKSWKPLSVS